MWVWRFKLRLKDPTQLTVTWKISLKLVFFLGFLLLNELLVVDNLNWILIRLNVNLKGKKS